MSMANKPYHVHITEKENPITLNLREIWSYRDLILLFTKRNFNLIYKQTVLGPVWVILTPLLTSFVYTVVFGEMAGLSTAGVPKMLFYLSSQALWSFFSGCLNRNAQTFILNAHVFGKVYFPRLTVPISNMLFSGIQFLVQLGMVAVILAVYWVRGDVHPHPLLLLVLIVPVLITGLLGLSLGVLVSSVTTKYRDLQHLVSFGVQLWMYISPVIYPVTQFAGGRWYYILLLNPLTAPMEFYRLALLGVGTVHPVSIISTVVFSAVLIPFSMVVFNRVEKNFIDTV